MYDAGAADYFDVLGVHAPGFKAPPEMSPDEVMAAEGVPVSRGTAIDETLEEGAEMTSKLAAKRTRAIRLTALMTLFILRAESWQKRGLAETSTGRN